jgi:hypothetical protein
LLDVVELAFPELVKVMGEIDDLLCQYRDYRERQVTIDAKSNLLAKLEKVRGFVKALDLDATLGSINFFVEGFNIHPADFPQYETLIERLLGFRRNLNDQLASKKIGFIPKDKLEYWNKEKLFGEEVFSKFKAARADLEEAGNCFAMGRNTACVFHLMRVMEVGLLRLAKRFRVKNIKALTWGDVLREINSKLDPRRKDPKKKAGAVRYDSALAHFRTAKNGWRDRVCHSTVSYNVSQALDIFSATKGFMRELAAMF